jgi:glyoxylase-like metal-dependent hydrolase (beta-lactamase superfamily II)
LSLRIAERWFDRKQVDDYITLLWEPHVNSWVRCNIWHVRGRDRDLFVDTGMGLAPLKAATRDLLQKPVTAVATHIHFDHVGGLHEFDDRIIHHLEADQMADYREWAKLDGRGLRDDFLNAFDDPELEIPDLLITASPHAGFEIEDYRIHSATPTRTVDEGDVIDLGDRVFEVLHLPGHSPGGIGLWEQSTGTLFSGDTIYDGPLLDELPESDIVSYIQSMKRLRELPVNVVHAGHEPSFGRERLRELVDAYLDWRDA